MSSQLLERQDSGMTVAHIAGLPFEELLAPLAATGSAIIIALRVAFSRLRRQT